jgi:16S rRNA (uracil1498-N3)-methyltransferase
VQTFAQWRDETARAGADSALGAALAVPLWLLAPGAAQPLHARLAAPLPARLRVLSGPEGGLTPDEEDAARALGAQAVSLGPRVLRAETAPLALLAALAACEVAP